jgi:hypothetical protein
MIKFDCKGFLENSGKSWRGYISKLVYSGGHLEISVHLADPIAANVCKTSSGFFVYFPYLENGLNLASLFDVEENVYRLLAIFADKDAATVAYAIEKVGNLLSLPHRRRKVKKGFAGELPF